MANSRATQIQKRRDTHDIDPLSDPCSPGSIEQQLDMCEAQGPKGDEVLRHPATRAGRAPDDEGESELPGVDQMMLNYNVDMAEDSREGDEMSGDEHSSGQQGDEAGLPEPNRPLDAEHLSTRRIQPRARAR